MRALACALVWLIGTLFGCEDIATIGGLCAGDCVSAGPGARGCDAGRCDASVDDDGGARLDACAAGGCSPDAGPVCSEERHELSRMRVDLMLVVDDSISLSPWWPALNDGLTQFLQTTEPSGLAVGLQRFDEICEPEPYGDPLVPIAPLADNRQALLQALPLSGVVSTSTIPALDGVLRYACTWAVDNPASRVAVVLLTDASPGACDGLVGDYDGEAQRLARAAYEGVPSIETYVIGFSTLLGPGPLALAGGTDPILIGVTPADGEVAAALERVRGAAQPCAFRWQTGWTLAPDSAVLLVAADGTERRVPILSSAAACAGEGGFYVANLAASYPLIACETTCESLAVTDRVSLSRACVER
jgi:hypothetical protein